MTRALGLARQRSRPAPRRRGPPPEMSTTSPLSTPSARGQRRADQPQRCPRSAWSAASAAPAARRCWRSGRPRSLGSGRNTTSIAVARRRGSAQRHRRTGTERERLRRAARRRSPRAGLCCQRGLASRRPAARCQVARDDRWAVVGGSPASRRQHLVRPRGRRRAAGSSAAGPSPCRRRRAHRSSSRADGRSGTCQWQSAAVSSREQPRCTRSGTRCSRSAKSRSAGAV